jgi:cytidine deaminase
MAAVAIRGGVVISVASNHRKRFGHAELRLASRTNDLTGATVYVMRWNKRVSRPCAMCRETMKFRGVKKAVFIDENGKVAEERYT